MHGHYSTSTRNISLEEYAASIQASSEGQAIHSSFLWTDSRDVDKQSSSLPHTYKQSVLTCGGITTDSVSSESKADSRDLPNVNRVYVKTEAHSDSRREANKEIKYDRPGKDIEKTDVTRFGEYGKEIHIPDARGDVKTGNNHLNWKDSKDHTRGKKYLEGNTVNVSGTMDSWHVPGNHLHAPNEIGNSEKVQGSKIIDTPKSGMKGEDKSMDKDRKRKDGKFRDWGESKKERCERNANLEAGYNTVDWRDMTKEKSEPDRSDKDAKHQDKEKEWPSEKEKDYHHVKIEPWSEVDNDSSTRRAPAKGVKIEDPEQKKLNISESWKVLSKESVHRKNERESLQNNLDADRPKKVNNIFEKEQEGHINGEDDIEGERETVPHGTPQLRRMSRAKGSPQMYNNENRSRPELSSLIYKVGECMQELMKLWQDYESSRCETVADSNDFPILEIRIPAEYVTATNRQVSGGQLWGTDVYTIDSDLVAVLMHTGYCRPTASPSPVVQELRATIRVLPPQDCYCSTLRNNVRSRAWGSAIGCSYRVEKCCILKKGGGRFELEPCVSHSSTIEPTLAPTVAERTMTTRASASNALRQQRFIREVTIQYNLCNEPWIKYSISVVADKGLKKPMYTSARLKKGEVLYLETHSCRYELCFSGEKIVKGGGGEVVAGDNIMPFDDNGDECVIVDVFRWSLCKKIFPQRVMRALGVPLRLEFVQVLEENIDWEDVQWSQSGVWISGKEYPLARMHFLSP